MPDFINIRGTKIPKKKKQKRKKRRKRGGRRRRRVSDAIAPDLRDAGIESLFSSVEETIA